MPQYTRQNGRPLLSMVGGKAHATRDDHEGPPTSKSQEIKAAFARCLVEPPAPATTKVLRASRSSNQKRIPQPAVPPSSDELPTKSQNVPTSSDSKAPASSSTSFLDDPMRSSQSRVPKVRRGYGKRPLVNIHAPRKKQRIDHTASAGRRDGSKTSAGDDPVTSRFASILNDISANSSPAATKPTPPPSRLMALAGQYNEISNLPSSDASAQDTTARTFQRLAGGSSPLSSPPLSSMEDIDDNDFEILDLTNMLPPRPNLPEGTEGIDYNTCPMCGAIVNQAQYAAFEMRHPKITEYLGLQRKFCRSHRTKEAHEQYKSHGYPDIQWDKLPERLKGYANRLRRIFRTPDASFYRARLETKIQEATESSSGRQNNDFWNTDEATIQLAGTGYYGLRGAEAMTVFIAAALTRELGEALRDQGDELVRKTGPTVYTQFVLVPEMTAMLIKDDMRVSIERARTILEESSAIGALVHGKQGHERQIDAEGELIEDLESEVDDQIEVVSSEGEDELSEEDRGHEFEDDDDEVPLEDAG